MGLRAQQDGVHLGHLSLGEVVLPQAPADRSHVGFGDGKPQRGEHVRRPVRGALQDGRGNQHHPQRRARSDRVHVLEVADLLPRRLPRRGRAARGWSRPRSARRAAGKFCRSSPDPDGYRLDPRSGVEQEQRPSPSRHDRRFLCPTMTGCHTRPGIAPGYSGVTLGSTRARLTSRRLARSASPTRIRKR